MDNKFEMPDYYSTSKPKSEEILIKRKCFHCNKEKDYYHYKNQLAMDSQDLKEKIELYLEGIDEF